VAVNLTTATVPTNGNAVVNKTALDAAIATVGNDATKLEKTNGVAIGLTTATVAAAAADIVSLRAAWKLNGDVRYWDAAGDGVTDDTAAITAAVNAVTNIFLPDGVFLINGTSIPVIDNLQIRTRGPGSATLKRTTTGSAVLNAAENRLATNVVVSGVRFLGGAWDSGDITRSAISFKTNGTIGATIRDCVFDRFVAGVRSQRGNTNLSVMGCRGIALADTLVLAYAPVGGRFIGNTLDGDRTGIGDGAKTRVGIWLHDPGDGAGPGWGNFVNVNRINGTRNEGIICNQALTVVDANIVTGCSDGASGTYGIVFETTGATGSGLVGLGAGCIVSATHNQIYNCDGGLRVSVDPVNLTQATPNDVLIDGNFIKGCTGANTKGICVGFSGTGTNYYGYRINVVNNTVHNPSATGNADGIFLLNVQNGSVTANHIYNAKRYGVILDTLAAGSTNQMAGVAITANDIHDPASAGVYLYPRVAGAIVRCSVNANTFTWSGTQTGNGVEVDNGVTSGIVECSFLGNSFQGNASYNGYGLLVNGSNLVAAGNVGNAVYGRIIATNGTTTWLSNGAVNDANGRKIFFDTAAPSSTAQAHNVGDIAWNTSLTSGGPVGWVCITAGTAGSSAGVWKDFGIAGIQAALDLKLDKTGGAISGNLTVGGTFGVTGATTLSGNTTVGGTLGVTGVTTLSDELRLPNAKFLRALSSAAALRNLLGIDANNYVVLGDASASRLYLKPGSGGLYLGALGESADIYVSRSGQATAGTTLRNSQALSFISSYYNGSTEVQVDNTIVGVAVNTSGKTGIKLRANATDVAYFYSDGVANFPVSISSPAIDASGSGFTGAGSGITALNMANAGSGTLSANGRGGTGQSSYTTGDTLYASSSTFLSKLAVGTSGQVYTVAAGVPSWATPSVAVGGITGLASGIATWLATPSSANLAAALTDETGSGLAVFATSPTLVTPALGTPSSVNLANGTGLPIGTGVGGLGTGISAALAATPTGSGVVVLATNAVLTTPTLGVASATSIAVASAASAGSVVSFGSITAGGNITGLNLSGNNTGDQTSVSGNAGTATTLATGRTIGITGDLTWTSPTFNGSGNVTASGTLASSGVAAGAYGSASYIPTITVDAKGRVTSITTNAVSGGGSGGGNVYTATTSTNGYMPMFSGATGTNLVQSFLFAETGVGLHIGSGTYGTGDSGSLYAGAAFLHDFSLFNDARTYSVGFSVPSTFSANYTVSVPAKTGTLMVSHATTGIDPEAITVGGGTFINAIRHGVATLVAGTVTVSQSSVTANTRIMLTSNGGGTTPGVLRVNTRSAGTSFTITSSIATDTDVVAWMMIEP
jgi:hypothetical protein